MSFARLLLRNLIYHWRGNLAVLLGIVLGSAVLTGALLVGDSLRGSLKALTLDQLGWVESAMLPGRFFRATLAAEISADKRSAILMLQGSVTYKGADDKIERVGKVTVLGVDASFWPTDFLPAPAAFWESNEREVVLNKSLATALGAKVGDFVTLHLERADSAPRETILAQRKNENVVEKIRVAVKQIVADEGLGRFSLKPSPVPVLNAFVPIKLLQERLDLAGREINAILSVHPIESSIKPTLDDWGLRYRSPKERAEAFVRYLDDKNLDNGNLKRPRWFERVPDDLAAFAETNKGILPKDKVIEYYEERRDYHVLESQRMLLEPQVVRAVETLVPGLDQNPEPRWAVKPFLIYLADTLKVGKTEVPYVIVASDNSLLPLDKAAPWIADDEALLIRWPNSPLKAEPGDVLTITYYTADAANHLEKKSDSFKVHAQEQPLEGMYDDPDYTPEFRGITDKLDMANWTNPPFPFERKRIKPADDAFWKRYRTTPRVYVNLKKAQELWQSRFGDLTSIQVRLGTDHPKFFEAALLAELKPEQGGFVFQPVREQAIRASAGSSDFGQLFAGFSSFLIIAALLLVGLLVRLNLDRRAREMGVLLATGWDHGRVRRLILIEGAILSVVGTAIGIGGALVYAQSMLTYLTANWPGGSEFTFLQLHAEPTSLLIGYLASMLVSLVTLFFATLFLSKRTPRALLAGETTQSVGVATIGMGWSWALIPIGILGAAGLAASGQFISDHMAQAGTFLGSGAMLLTACLAAVWQLLKRFNHASSPQPSLVMLGLRNAGRHSVRSLLTVGLLASASFLIVAVESFHKDADQHFYEKTGGSGGFAFFAESSIPIFEDLNQAKVRRDNALNTPELYALKFYPFRVQPGDDASCLNLYKPLKPRVMGVPKTLIDRGGFAFAGGTTDVWSKLETVEPDDAIPAIIDKNTADWILKVGRGDTIEIIDQHGDKKMLRIVALLNESIFQSEVLISEENFLKLFPQQTGFSFFLIDVGETDAAKLKTIETQLGKSLGELGLDTQTTASRLQAYVAVENTYLATFQALGGLGLMLGAVGLSIVLLRGVWERRSELALLLALGFRTGQLAWLVLVENAFLLALGLASGTIAALLAVAPHLVGAGSQVLWLRIAVLLALVLVVGLVSAGLAVWSTLRTPVLTALRRE